VNQVIRAGPNPDHTNARILDAALRVLTTKGTRQATMDDIAAESGVGRTTLFRRFAGKDQLFERALAREFSTLLSDLAEQFTIVTDPTEQVIVAFAACIRMRDHILLRDTAATNRADLIFALSQGDPSPIALSHHAIRANIARAQQTGKIPPGDPDAQADVLIHLMIGYLTAPSLIADLTDPAAVDRLVRNAVAQILTGQRSSS
jgi:AcrR family transcriptional regulator